VNLETRILSCMTGSTLLTEISGVGEALAKKFAVLGINNVTDLINYYPRRYEDFSSLNKISQLKPGNVTIEAEIKQANGRYVRRGLHITEAIASDDTGSVRLVWFNQPYRAKALQSGKKYFISGQYELSRQRFVILNASVELASDFPLNTARILAVYKETKGLTSRQIRAAIFKISDYISKLPESLPDHLVKSHNLMSRSAALKALHMPQNSSELEIARYRMGFEEVFNLSLASLLNKLENQNENALSVEFNEQLVRHFVKELPFKLTDAQRKTCWQVFRDMQRSYPMNRLVEGDVGSGKTVVATMAALEVMEEGYQVAFMAPTEILARQHAETIFKLLKPLNKQDELVLLVGSMKEKDKAEIRNQVKSGQKKLIIGTHSLIQDKLDMHKLALVIIDEQHRFGVEQRKTLMSKAGHMPHVLSLTATPIPRSLALTLYGELDISVLDEKPAGRQHIITEIISPNSRAQLYKKIDNEIEAGRQVFVVCPIITDSDVLDVNSVEKVFEELSKKHFKHRKVALLHGKMKTDEKQVVMEDFISRKIDILVSTTVIEVGVDVPNASVMMIESAERFGLAQLHQLRGRVGRGAHQAYCFLLLSDSAAPSRRLRALTSSNDGFKLAELDLELRGPGAIYGVSQHGALDLRIAQLTDVKLIAAARSSAQEFIDAGDSLLKYKELASRINRLRTVTNLN